MTDAQTAKWHWMSGMVWPMNDTGFPGKAIHQLWEIVNATQENIPPPRVINNDGLLALWGNVSVSIGESGLCRIMTRGKSREFMLDGGHPSRGMIDYMSHVLTETSE